MSFLRFRPVINGILSSLILALSVSCNRSSEETVYSQFQNISPEGWDPNEVIAFEPWPADSLVKQEDFYGLNLVVRYSSRHETGVFPMLIALENEDGLLRSDTIIINVNDTENKASSIREQYGIRELTLEIDSLLKLKDGFAVSLSPLTQKEKTKGLLNLGIILKRKNK